MSSFYKEHIFSGLETNVKNPDNNSQSYRYYHCYLDWNGLKCKKVDGPDVLSKVTNTQLLAINNYFPEKLDPYILKYKIIPNNIFIEK
jgi:hypothetical protein